MRSSVDVFVPNRDYGQWLTPCIDSVLSQDGVDVRVVVVDNASKDDSVELVERAAERDSRVVLLRHAEDLGLIQSLNDGLDWCEAEFAVNLSADDVLAPGALARATEVLRARPDVGFVYGPAALHRHGRPAPAPAVRSGTPVPRIWDGQWWIGRCAATAKNPIFSPEVVMRTSVAQQVRYDPALPQCPDLGMWLGLAARGSVAHVRRTRQAVYRLHPGSMMHTQGLVTGVESRWRAFSLLVERDGALLGQPQALLDAAARALALEAVRIVEKHYDWGRQDRLPAEELLELARRLWPEVTSSGAWAALEHARSRTRLSPVRLGHLVLHKASYETREKLRRERGLYGVGTPWPSRDGWRTPPGARVLARR